MRGPQEINERGKASLSFFIQKKKERLASGDGETTAAAAKHERIRGTITRKSTGKGKLIKDREKEGKRRIGVSSDG